MRGKTWDIFCHVVDNFGDVGVCWRMARQLAAEHALSVQLWVDDQFSLGRLCPEINVLVDDQVCQGVRVRHWVNPFPEVEVADVVIEAFACELPASYLVAMAAVTPGPVWINLEYLSAEDWVGRCHGLASPHPRLGLTKHFFFPGFTATSGGLLREANLIEHRDAFQTAAPATTWRALGLSPPEPGESTVSLFCYENPALPELLAGWTMNSTPLRCVVPAGIGLTQVAQILGNSPLEVGTELKRGNLTVCALPFLSQEQYDRLLWSCDLNFVRGEDSFVRAQLAARPMVWHIYPQDDGSHIAKLEAFLDRYVAKLPPPASVACGDLWMAWNRGDGAEMAAAWPEFGRSQVAMRAHAWSWSERLCKHADLTRQLVLFCETLL